MRSISGSSVLTLLCWGLLVPGGGMGAEDSAFPAEALKVLREEVKLMFGVLPDTMPGSEKDTPARIELGRKLYLDPLLSENRTQSCNTCHRVDDNLAGVDNEATSEGAHEQRGDRNSPTVWNAGFHFAQFWDGRAATLEEQAKGPVLNPVEMAMPSEEVVVARLTADAAYLDLFAKAFPGSTEPISYDRMAEAIAAFERTLISRDRFDDFQRGDDGALTVKELEGLRLVLDMGCTACHNGPVLGGTSYQKSGLVNPYEYAKDLGRFIVTQTEEDKYKFKVPSWRNVALTYPYFHDGKVARLEEVVKRMGHMQLGLEFSAEQIERMTAFLGALSGKNLRALPPS